MERQSAGLLQVSNPIPIYISQPFICIIGTTQTTRVQELLRKGYKENGLLDRILFVLPRSQKIAEWKTEDLTGNSAMQEQSTAMADKWNAIVQKVIDLDYLTSLYEGEERQTSHMLTLNEEAAQVFAAWWNDIALANNAIENDCDVESRDMKLPTHIARLALLFQVARYACGESHLDFVNADSVRAAIRLTDYLEDCYSRLTDNVTPEASADQLTRFLDSLPDTFTKAESLPYARRMGIGERNTANKLNKLIADGRLFKRKYGIYTKQRPTEQDEVESAAETNP